MRDVEVHHPDPEARSRVVVGHARDGDDAPVEHHRAALRELRAAGDLLEVLADLDLAREADVHERDGSGDAEARISGFDRCVIVGAGIRAVEDDGLEPAPGVLRHPGLEHDAIEGDREAERGPPPARAVRGERAVEREIEAARHRAHQHAASLEALQLGLRGVDAGVDRTVRLVRAARALLALGGFGLLDRLLDRLVGLGRRSGRLFGRGLRREPWLVLLAILGGEGRAGRAAFRPRGSRRSGRACRHRDRAASVPGAPSGW